MMDDSTVVSTLVLYPAAEPCPALKYRLLPARLDQIPGNAAVHYGKVTAEETRFFADRELWENIRRWQETPLEELRQLHVHMRSGGGIEYSLRRGAHCRYCDWQLPIGDEPFYDMLMSDAQQTRGFGTILAARARIHLAEGRFTDALDSLQTGYALGQHVAKGEPLVSCLVGIAISGIMSRQLLEFVQQPQAPSLYWALTLLPQPLIDMRDAVDVEANGVELSFPELRNLSELHLTPESWRDLFHRVAKQALSRVRHGDPWKLTVEQIDDRCQQKLPVAEQVLLTGGLSADVIEKMSLHQIALQFSLLTYRELVDGAMKLLYLPYPQSIAEIKLAIERAKSEQREIIPLAERVLGSLLTAKTASARTDRTIAELRVLEALRIHAASHDGNLPEKLADITDVPVPDDPVTGKPFEYRRSDDKAILSGPTFRDVPLNFEITMVRPK